MFESTTLQRLNQSGRTKARQEIRTWTKVKAASAPPPAAHVKQDGASCCWPGLPATSLLPRWLGSLSACF
jgi:hypothetical protein